MSATVREAVRAYCEPTTPRKKTRSRKKAPLPALAIILDMETLTSASQRSLLDQRRCTNAMAKTSGIDMSRSRDACFTPMVQASPKRFQ